MTVQDPYYDYAQAETPFLRRNFVKGLKSWSGLASNAVAHKKNHSPDGTPPPKRQRRLPPTKPLDLDGMLAPPSTSSDSPRDLLRLDVLKIRHKDKTKRLAPLAAGPPPDATVTKARCKVTIVALDAGSEDTETMYCETRLCDIMTFNNPSGPTRIAQIALPDPFTIKVESLLTSQNDATIGFSRQYQVLVELRSAGKSDWPPLQWSDFGEPGWSVALDEHCALSAVCDTLYGKVEAPLTFTNRATPSKRPQVYKTDYTMVLDLKWASGFKSADAPLDAGGAACINALEGSSNSPVSQDGEEIFTDQDANGLSRGHVDDDGFTNGVDEEMLGGDHTPTRLLRVREKTKNYNVKLLSDKQLGRDKKASTNGHPKVARAGRVMYRVEPDQPICLDGFCCVACQAFHEDVGELRLHFMTNHPLYEFLLEHEGQVPSFRVVKSHKATKSPNKAFQLGPPTKPFILSSLISGDSSWASSRFISGGDADLIKTPTKSARTVDRLGQLTPTTARASAAPKAPIDKVRVPNTGHPVFHPVSRVLLKPGSEVPKPEPDDRWLLQKHRDAIDEFSDVHAGEKEYMHQWDAFILPKKLTSDAYFPRTWVQFTRENAEWLVSKPHRILEWGKHLSTINMRDLLRGADVDEAMALIKCARQTYKAQPPSTQVDQTSAEAHQEIEPSLKAPNACGKCGLIVQSRPLICSNKSCSHRLYHRACVNQTDKRPPRDWRCGPCTLLEEEAP